MCCHIAVCVGGYVLSFLDYKTKAVDENENERSISNTKEEEYKDELAHAGAWEAGWPPGAGGAA